MCSVMSMKRCVTYRISDIFVLSNFFFSLHWQAYSFFFFFFVLQFYFIFKNLKKLFYYVLYSCITMINRLARSVLGYLKGDFMMIYKILRYS